MATRTIDIALIGAGIAGLWAFNRLKRMGYDVLLLEREGIGAGQTLASQGIIHSGLKYAFAGKINELAHSISAMPDLWRTALKGDGAVDLSAASGAASSQYLLIPPGFMGGLIGLVSKKALGGNVTELAPEDWPDSIKQSGFNGSVIYMDEPVLDIAAIIRALAEPYKNCIRKIDSSDPFDYLRAHKINAKNVIFTAAQSNQEIAAVHGHDEGLKTQARPLLMGMMKNAPYPLYAHLVGPSEKPVATITTHKTQSGDLVWYLGGGVAERDGALARLDIITGTLAKAFGVMGGYITGSRNLVDFVRSFASGFIFTTALPPALAAGAEASIRHLKQSTVERAAQQANVAKVRAALDARSIPHMPNPSHIVPVMVGDAKKCKWISDILLENYGIYVQPINYPTVPVKTERLRITPNPSHTNADIDHLAGALCDLWSQCALARAVA